MARQATKLTIVAIATMFLSLLIVSFPAGNSKEGTIEHPLIEEARIMIEWGHLEKVTGTNGTTMTGSTMSGSILWDGTISLPGGHIQVIRPLTQNNEDGIIDMEGESVRFMSQLQSGYDGVFIRVFPGMDSSSLVFTTKTGLEVKMNLNYFLSNQLATAALAEGKGVSFKKEAITLNKGSLQLQYDKLNAQRVRECMQSSDEKTCRDRVGAELRNTQVDLMRKKLSRLWQARSIAKSGTGSVVGLHPDFLLFMGSEDLYNINSQTFRAISLDRLSDINQALYSKILTTYPQAFGTLPFSLQEKAMLLEGSLPEDIRNKAALSEGEFQIWKQVLLGLPEMQRVEIATKLRALPTEILATMKTLDAGKARKVMERILLIPDTGIGENTMLYLDQLSTVETLRKKFSQIKGRLGSDDALALEKVFGAFDDNFMYQAPLVPSIYRKLDELFTSIALLPREAISQEIRTISNEISTSIKDSRTSRYKVNLASFTDVDDGSWQGYYILKAKSLGAIDGYKTSDNVLTGTYGPENPVRIGELLKIALELSENGTSEKAPALASANSHWAKKYVARAEELQLSILNDTSIDLNRPATRGEVVQTILEAFTISPDLISKSTFTDVSPFANYARFVEFARKLGIVSGDDGKNTFRPLESVNRAETAKIATTIVYFIKTPLEKSDVSGDLGL